MISEKDIRRAIRLAIKAKQIEKNPILEEEEDFGIKAITELPTFVESPLLKRLKNNLKDKEGKGWGYQFLYSPKPIPKSSVAKIFNLETLEKIT